VGFNRFSAFFEQAPKLPYARQGGNPLQEFERVNNMIDKLYCDLSKTDRYNWSQLTYYNPSESEP
jgi:hypothetical protein